MVRQDGALPASARPPARPRRLILPVAVLCALLLAALVVVDVVAPGAVPGMTRLPRPWAGAALAACTPTEVAVVAAPEIVPALTAALAEVQHRALPDGHCVRVDVRGQDPVDTIASARVLQVAQAPQLWVPDSSLRAAQVSSWPLTDTSSFAVSPVILTGGRSALAARGWGRTPPTWADAITGAHAAALPDLQTSVVGVTAIAALWRRLGRGAPAQRALVAAVLTATRTPGVSVQNAVDGALRDDPRGAVVVASEAAVVAANRDAGAATLAVSYPDGAAPLLDYPVLRVAPAQQSGAQTMAVDAVVATLHAPAARALLGRNGFRAPGGAPIADGGDADSRGGGASPVRTESARVTPLPLPTGLELTALLQRLATLAIPSRLLTVVDVSESMRALVPGTQINRVQLASRAAIEAGRLLADDSASGLWEFARLLPSGRPWRSVLPVAPLGSPDGPGTHRDALFAALAALPDQVSGGGTALFATTLAAMREMRRTYDPRAINAVVLFTDGANESDDSLALADVVRQLTADAAAHPAEPIELIAIALGPTADLAALQAMAGAARGQAYRAQTPDELRTVLLDGIARRPTD